MILERKIFKSWVTGRVEQGSSLLPSYMDMTYENTELVDDNLQSKSEMLIEQSVLVLPCTSKIQQRVSDYGMVY